MKKRAAKVTLRASATPRNPYKNKLEQSHRQMLWGHNYEGADNTLMRRMYGYSWSQTESQMLPYNDRVKVIAWLRNAMRNNPIVAGILRRYTLGVGTPSPRISYADTDTNDKIERFLESKFENLRFGVSSYAATFHRLISVAQTESVIGGECFAVFMRNGQIRLIPSEFCGSPKDVYDADGARVEEDGIIYWKSGAIRAYRFGRRIGGCISFDEKHTAVVPAQFVHHLGTPTRDEEQRYSPKLAPAMCAIQDLKDIMSAKTAQIKAQSCYATVTKKNIAPEIAAELAQSFNSDPDAPDFGDFITARTKYKAVTAGMNHYLETGEDIEMIEPKFNASDFTQFAITNCDFICGCLQMPTEEAIIGYRNSNYSSARADKLRWHDAVTDERLMWTSFADKIQYWLIMRGILLGELDVPEEIVRERIDWIYPPLREIDETKAAQANISLYDKGLRSKTEIVGRDGRYADEVDRERVLEAVNLIKTAREISAEHGIDAADVMPLLRSQPAAAAPKVDEGGV